MTRSSRRPGSARTCGVCCRERRARCARADCRAPAVGRPWSRASISAGSTCPPPASCARSGSRRGGSPPTSLNAGAPSLRGKRCRKADGARENERPPYFMAVGTLPNVASTCDRRPFTEAIIATAIPAAMRPYSMRRPLAAAVRAIQHCAVETDEGGGCNGLLYLSVGRTSSFCRSSVSEDAICTRNLCCHTEGNELLRFPVQGSRGIHYGQVFVP
jgi:hypothetical protein